MGVGPIQSVDMDLTCNFDGLNAVQHYDRDPERRSHHIGSQRNAPTTRLGSVPYHLGRADRCLHANGNHIEDTTQGFFMALRVILTLLPNESRVRTIRKTWL